MKHKLAFLLVLLVASVARADSIYEIHAVTDPSPDFPGPFGLDGSYELNSHGQIVGPWSFTLVGAGSGEGLSSCEPFCPYATVTNGVGFFDSGRNINDPETPDRSIQFNLGQGPISGEFSAEACNNGLYCSIGYGSFTGTATLEHVPEPEPSSLLLTIIGLLGVAAFCSLRRLSPLAICRG